jgi:hypothetical protein
MQRPASVQGILDVFGRLSSIRINRVMYVGKENGLVRGYHEASYIEAGNDGWTRFATPIVDALTEVGYHRDFLPGSESAQYCSKLGRRCGPSICTGRDRDHGSEQETYIHLPMKTEQLSKPYSLKLQTSGEAP